MKSFATILSILAVASVALADACPAVNTAAAGSQNVGVAGAQFVTGQCTSDANCASGCCVLQGSTPVCRNEPALSGGLKCGFSCDGAGAAAAPPAADPAPAASGGGACPAVDANAAGSQNVGVAGAQFVTGQCTSDANCASGCCVLQGSTPVCRNEPALSGGLKCGFSCGGAAAPAPAPEAPAAPAPAPAANACPAVDPNAAGSQNVGKAGAQFVTGQCTSDANCASGCCVLQGSTPVCRNEPALSGGLKCGFSCDGSAAAAPAPAPAPATGGGACPAVDANAAGSQNVGVAGAQFVTGQCTSDANCASGCCVLQGSTPVCRNEPALSGGLKCGFSCGGAAKRLIRRKALPRSL